MIKVNIRELSHNLAHYLKKVKQGERVVVCERNKPVADLIPHNENIVYPSWKRPIKRIKVKGEPMSETLIRMRREEER